jgi:hypothetical protein
MCALFPQSLVLNAILPASSGAQEFELSRRAQAKELQAKSDLIVELNKELDTFKQVSCCTEGGRGGEGGWERVACRRRHACMRESS